MGLNTITRDEWISYFKKLKSKDNLNQKGVKKAIRIFYPHSTKMIEDSINKMAKEVIDEQN